MMTCPACGAEIVDDEAWMCPVCEHIVRTEILGLERTHDLGSAAIAAAEEGTEDPITSPHLEADFDVNEAQTLTGEEAIDPDDAPYDARIIGDLDDETAEISAVFPTPGPLAGPSISKVILYAAERSWRLLQPGAVPSVVDASRSASPLEAAALSLIDGVRSIDDIRRDTKLPRNEIDGALLLLMDKGVIHLDLNAARDRPASVLEPVYPTEMTAEDAGEDPANEADRTMPPRPRPTAKRGLPAARKGGDESPPMLDDDLLEEVFTAGGVSSMLPRQASSKATPDVTASAPALPLPTDAIVESSPPAPAPAPAAPPPKPKPAAPANPLAERALELGRRAEARTRKMIEQAAKDIEKKEMLSAETNLKLALSFDPANRDLKRLVNDVGREVPKDKRAPAKPAQRVALLDQATQKESAGDLDGAIEILERALRQSKDAAVYNRLGVILATKKRDVVRGRELIEKAVELAPDNETYKHNLGKVLARAAAADIADRKSGKNAGGGGEGIFGIFGKKK